MPQPPRSAEEPPPFLGQIRSPSALWKMAPAWTARRADAAEAALPPGEDPPHHPISWSCCQAPTCPSCKPLGGEATASPPPRPRPAARGGAAHRPAASVSPPPTLPASIVPFTAPPFPRVKWTRLSLASACGAERTIASWGEDREERTVPSPQGGSNLPPPHGGMGGGREEIGSAASRSKANGKERGDGRRRKGGVRCRRAGAQAGMRQAGDTNHLPFPRDERGGHGRGVLGGEAAQFPHPRRRPLPTMVLAGRGGRRSAVRRWRLLPRMLGAARAPAAGREAARARAGRKRCDVTAGGGSGCYGGSPAWQRPGTLLLLLLLLLPPHPARRHKHACIRPHPVRGQKPKHPQTPPPKRGQDGVRCPITGGAAG